MAGEKRESRDKPEKLPGPFYKPDGKMRGRTSSAARTP
jgi:hypothetical protein